MIDVVARLIYILGRFSYDICCIRNKTHDIRRKYSNDFYAKYFDGKSFGPDCSCNANINYVLISRLKMIVQDIECGFELD